MRRPRCRPWALQVSPAMKAGRMGVNRGRPLAHAAPPLPRKTISPRPIRRSLLLRPIDEQLAFLAVTAALVGAADIDRSIHDGRRRTHHGVVGHRFPDLAAEIIAARI